jgi:hypothetical protein
MLRACNRSTGRRAGLRAFSLRFLALLVTLLALGAQQRELRAQRVVSDAALRVLRERPETLESKALRATPSVRVAPAPFLERLKVVALGVPPVQRANARWLVSRALTVQGAQVLTHFHALRRIPRMNTEEPPRV